MESDLENQPFQHLDEDDDDIEILEVVGLDEDAPGASGVVTQEAPDEVVLSFEDEASAVEVEPLPESEGAAEAAASLQRLVRLQADFDNFKKRVERERQRHDSLATAGLVARMLPVLDNFERALVAAPPSASSNGLMDGVSLIFRQLLDELRKEGLTAIESVGQQFDPNLHEAVDMDSSPGHHAYVVTEELQRGYVFNGRLLRPALVKVSADDSV